MHLPMKGYTHLVSDGACVRLDGALVRLSGADAEEWLQGQVTNDLRRLDARPFVDACLTKSTGQLEAALRIWRRSDGLTVSTTDLASLAARVSDYVILEDVTLEVVSEDVWTWQSSVPLTEGLPSPRTLPFGAESASRPEGVPQADEEAWGTVCLERGLALVGTDSDSKTLPPELGPAFESSHVAYDKGCYVGQEILQRIHSRGHTNRTWVVLQCEAAVHAGADVALDGASVGKVTRGCVSPRFGPLAGAMLANKAVAEGTRLRVAGVLALVVEPPALIL